MLDAVSIPFIKFAIADRIEAPVWGKRAASRHNEKRLSTLILDIQKFSQNFNWSQGLSNDECPWICNIIGIGYNFVRERSRIPPVTYTSVGLLRCRPTPKGNARSLCMKDGDGYRFLRFSRIYINANEGMTAAG